MKSWKYFCLLKRVTRWEKPSLSDQKQITFSKDEIFTKFCQFYDKKKRNKYKKWIKFILHCFYVDIPSFQWISLISCRFEWNWGISLFHPLDRNFKWILENSLLYWQHPLNFNFLSNWALILIKQKYQIVLWSRFW